MKKLITLFITLFVLQTSFAINIEGRILDKDTNEPIAGAVLLALSNNKVMSSVESNIKGDFKISLKKGKMIHLEVVKNGYRTESADVEINQAFVTASPFITIKLQRKEATETKEISKSEKTMEAVMEDVGDLSALPEGYKIIEAVPIKNKEEKTSGFNVTQEVRDQTTNVNVAVLKTEYNKYLESDALIPNINFTTSYYDDGSIYYNVAKAFLSPKVKEILLGIALRLKNDNTTMLKLNVFADANKEAKIGEYISKLRIEEIVSLMMNEGVSFEQLDINVIGNQMVRNDCREGIECTEEQHQENRKIELLFVK
ncbi:MAG: hypothetical protein ACI8ZX_000515 [Planctomycetota bacterium]|jgi:hypothetical protein